MADRATREQLVEKVARAMFDAWPMHAVSPALAEKAGVPIGTPLTWDQVIEMGGDHNGLLRLARAAISSLSPPSDETLRGALERMRADFCAMRDKCSAHNGVERGNHAAFSIVVDRIDAALTRTAEPGEVERVAPNRLAELRHWFFQTLDPAQRKGFLVAAGIAPKECDLSLGMQHRAIGIVAAALSALPAQGEPSEDVVEDFLAELDGWESAYPLSAFPEPDFAKAAELLKAGGMTLDAISASNMRHVVSRIAPKARAALSALPAQGEPSELPDPPLSELRNNA